MSLTIGIVVIGLLTIGAALRVRGRKMSAPLGMIVCGALAIGFLAGAAAYTAVQNQRVRDQCVSSVTRSDGNRQQWLALAAFLEQRGVATDAIEFIRTSLDVNLPQRDLSECT